MTTEELIESQKAELLARAIQEQQVSATHSEHLTILWRDAFSLSKDPAGRLQLATPSGVPPTEEIRRRLSSPEWSHYTANGAHPGMTREQADAAGLDKLRAFAGLPNSSANGGAIGFGMPSR